MRHGVLFCLGSVALVFKSQRKARSMLRGPKNGKKRGRRL